MMASKTPIPSKTERAPKSSGPKPAHRCRTGARYLNRSVLDALSAHIAILDEAGRILAVNGAWRRFAEANHSRPETVCEGADYFSICEAARGEGAGGAAEFLRAARRILAGEQSEFALEYPCHSPDEQRWFNVQVTRFTCRGDLRLAVAHETVTERKLTEMALRHSERLYRAVVEDQTELISRFKSDGTFTFVNHVYCQYFGKTPNELIGNKWQPVAYPDDVPMIEARLATMSPANPVVVIENRAYRESGEIGWFQFINRGFFDKTGSLVETQSVGRDITERKQAEQSLAESELKYRRLHESMRDAFAAVDMTGRIQEFNTAFRNMLGYSDEELKRLTYQDITPAKWHAAEARIIADQVFSRGYSDLYEKQYLREDGSTLPVELRTYLIRDRTGNPEQMWAVIRDLSDRKRAEDKLRASQRQMRALAARCQAGREEERSRIAREFHDVLAQELTQLKIDLARTRREVTTHRDIDPREALPDRLSEMMHTVDTAIACVQKIATELRPVVLDSLGLCAAVEWQAREFQSRTGIQCQAEVPADERVKDRDTATAVFRIVQEALTNVARHSKATQVRIRLRIETGRVLLRVSDNGCGMSQESIHDPMSIGLAGMRERAQLLGGQFDIRSRPESGTTIAVRIPLRQGAGASEDAP